MISGRRKNRRGCGSLNAWTLEPIFTQGNPAIMPNKAELPDGVYEVERSLEDL